MWEQDWYRISKKSVRDAALGDPSGVEAKVVTLTRWMLPEGVEDMLPPDAWQVELLRRKLLDLYRSWGYELVMPPLIEYLDSLLTGAGEELTTQTFKLTDQLSGRTLGVRADVTPQAARIDANRMAQDVPARLCYIDSVLRTRPASHGGARTLRQVGCELFGHDGIDSDREVIALMLETLAVAGVPEVHIDIGHVGVFRALAEHAGLEATAEAEVFDLLQRKSRPDLAASPLSDTAKPLFDALMGMNGGREVIARAREAFASCGGAVAQALDALDTTLAWLAERHPGLPVHVDLAELRGYRYHTGLVFGAFIADHGRELARGGRYNNVGAAFGSGRAATGFSANLHDLLRFGTAEAAPMQAALAQPEHSDEQVRAARASGQVVVRGLPGAADPPHSGIFEESGDTWSVASKHSDTGKTP